MYTFCIIYYVNLVRETYILIKISVIRRCDFKCYYNMELHD